MRAGSVPRDSSAASAMWLQREGTARSPSPLRENSCSPRQTTASGNSERSPEPAQGLFHIRTAAASELTRKLKSPWQTDPLELSVWLWKHQP